MSFKSEVEAAAAHNSTNHDAQHYINKVFASSRAHHITPRRDARDDVVRADVSRNLVCQVIQQNKIHLGAHYEK